MGGLCIHPQTQLHDGSQYRNDPQTSVLALADERRVRSKIRWFAESCESHYVSHVAAFFIVARTKISIVASRVRLWVEVTVR